MRFLSNLFDRQQRAGFCASNNPHPTEIGKLRLMLSEGLTGWVAREHRLLAISREAFSDPRFKYFSQLPEDTFESFLSAPVIARNRVVGVINVQHRRPHQHSGSELELITTVGEQVGCLLELARIEPQPAEPPEAMSSWFSRRRRCLPGCNLLKKMSFLRLAGIDVCRAGPAGRRLRSDAGRRAPAQTRPGMTRRSPPKLPARNGRSRRAQLSQMGPELHCRSHPRRIPYQ